MGTKLSQISSGGLFNQNTDTLVGVRNGTADVLVAFDLNPTVVPVTGTTKTLSLTDANTIQDCANASAQAITLPLNANVAFPINTIIQFEQNGAGIITLTGATGVTVNGTLAGSFVSTAQYEAFYIRQESTDDWYAQTGQASSSTGGTNGQIQYKNGSVFGGFTASGDATINTSTGDVAVTKTGGVSFAASATTDTTDAANIASGTLASARLTAAVQNMISKSCFYSAPTNITIPLMSYAESAFTINGLNNLQTSAGSISLSIQINGTNVTGLSGLTVNSTPQSPTASGANTVAVGNRVTMVLSSNSSSANLEFAMKGTIA